MGNGIWRHSTFSDSTHIVIGGDWSHLRVTCYNDGSLQWYVTTMIKINGRAVPMCAHRSLHVHTHFEYIFNEKHCSLFFVKIVEHCCALCASQVGNENISIRNVSTIHIESMNMPNT